MEEKERTMKTQLQDESIDKSKHQLSDKEELLENKKVAFKEIIDNEIDSAMDRLEEKNKKLKDFNKKLVTASS